MRRQPVIQPHGVGACGKGLGEGVFALVAGHQPGQRLAVARASLQQLVGQGDRLAILVQPHKHRHVLARTADAQVHAVDQPIQHMSEIQLAVHELVPHAGPGSLLGQRDGDAVLLVQAQRRGHHHGRAIRQRDEADLHLGLFRRIGAGRPGAGAHQRIYQGQQARARRRARGPASQLRRPASAPSRGSGFGACSERSWCDDMGMAPGKKRPARHGPDPVAGETSCPWPRMRGVQRGRPPLAATTPQASAVPTPPPRARTGAKSVIPHGYWLDGRSTRARTDTLRTHTDAPQRAPAHQACARHARACARRAAVARAAAWHGNCVITAIRICRIERPMLKVMLLNDGEDARRRCGRRWRPRACSSWPRPRRAWIWPQRSKTPLPMWC